LDLSEQAAHFTAVEIAHAIKESPANRAPGPDGFSISFFRVTWGVVGCDVVHTFQALWELDFRNFHHLNEAVMVLLHKTQSPASFKDYRPISLIHSIGKLFSKCLSLHLAPRMGELIKHNQSAFIRGRQIHENFKMVQLTCRWLHARHCPTVLLKIDLAKAFDSVAWPFLLVVVEHAGFPQRWQNWLSAMLRTASTRVLVNGCPGRRICHTRGLRHGDPLSSLLFVLVMEVLNALIHEADCRGIFSPLPEKIKHRTSIYADDLVIFLMPDTSGFVNLRRMLDLFTAASGLLTNVNKCIITPIRCTQPQIDAVLQAFPCKVQDFPTRYLGAPLSLSRLARVEEQRLVDMVAARIPTWKGSLLNHAGRATLVQSTLSAIPVHVSICCCLSSWGIEAIDRRRRAFLWAGADSLTGGRCRVAWPIVCAPKDHGGLGIPDLKILGYALRLRWEWLRRTKPESPWVLLPSSSEKAVSSMFSASYTVELGDGASARFWTDAWLPMGPISSFAPNLFRAVGRRRLRRSVRDALTDRQWVRDITGARTPQVLLEYVRLWRTVRDVQLQPLLPDRFVWQWTTDGRYSVRSAYRAYFTGWTAMAGAKKLWRATVPPKVKFFFWLALHG
jgi:hypothetical protein